MDQDATGRIQYVQFLAAAIEQRCLNEETLKETFDRMDVDKSGFITKENLRDIFKGQLSEEKELLEFERMLEEAGCSDSRGMDRRDFATMVKNPRPVEHVLSPKSRRAAGRLTRSKLLAKGPHSGGHWPGQKLNNVEEDFRKTSGKPPENLGKTSFL